MDDKVSFTTIVSWILIALFSIGAFFSLLQNAMIFVLVPIIMSQAKGQSSSNVTQFHLFMARASAFTIPMLVFCILMVVSAVLLLKRRKLGLYGTTILLSLNVLIALGFVVYFLLNLPMWHVEKMPDLGKKIMTAVLSIVGVVEAAVMGATIFVVVKLNTGKIRKEFDTKVPTKE